MLRCFKIGIFCCFVLACTFVCAQNDSVQFIQVHFLYGSKPARGHKKTEFKYFGGIHGGHVTIQIDSMDYGFEPSQGFHVFAHRKKYKSDYVDKRLSGTQRYPDGNKAVTFIVPVSKEQNERIRAIIYGYCSSTPYDYAFFGMRCAASTSDILAQIGLQKKRNRFLTISRTFYPKKLRKRMFRLAEKNGYKVVRQEGRSSRKWEKD
ncbi:MAG: hypothetical protein K0S33_2616 [Bacteroidetes bacterium]|jgi:hypothetical protein|nr:hypothetical protein [Bacteroidota bacterium]